MAEARATFVRDRGQWQVQTADDLAAARTELEARTRGMPALQSRMDRTIVRAPRSGRVDKLLVATVGAAVRAGEPLVEIVPDDDMLIVEVKVRPQGIGHVAPGQTASVNVTAYEAAIYGSLTGSVA
ncbi:HlyD family efflux transporter periplasmic adaptor subunit [Sphingomonas gellani]|uniref:HlyD family efflux transporter periplasmic adaptor subunit n=1 Tax=Sphingomonas gellani TaxID=1166340 RepID=UPI001114252F|nr:HlyD family efflux transporter periplasmic adaptor subunit [Sphingomonas gellani]